MSKLERKVFMQFCSFDGTNWEVLGVDNDDLSKELNPDTETSKNVLGETTFKHNGYEPEIGVDPYYADSDSALYEDLSEIALEEKFDDASIKGYYVDGILTTSSNGVVTGSGKKRAAYIVPQSIGGDTSGLGIPFNVNPIGPMTDVTISYTVATRAVTITAAT